MISEIKFINNNSLEKFRFKTLFTKEPETIFWIKKINKKDTLIDIGANVGVYSLFAGKNNIKTFSIEPFQKNYKSLKQNIRLNNLKNVKALNFAISNFKGKAFFNDGGDTRHGSSGGFISKKKILKKDKSINVTTVDNLMKTLKIKNNFHIKIEIDKDLIKLLKGFKKTIKNKKLKSVLIEVEKIEKKEVMAFFKPFMKVLNLEKIVKNHSSNRRAKKNSSIRNIIFSRK